MERLTPRKPLRLRLDVNHTTKRLDVIATGVGEHTIEGTLTVDEINDLRAELSQSEYALTLSESGVEPSPREAVSAPCGKASF